MASTALSVIAGFRRVVDEICALLGYYAASNGNPLPTFRDNVSVLSSSFKESKKKGRSRQEYAVNMGKRPIRCAETSVKDCHSTLRNTPEEQRFYKCLACVIARLSQIYY
jgi:hypothetical protein